MPLVRPHGPPGPAGAERRLRPLLLADAELAEAKRESLHLPRLRITSREASDLIMLGIGAYTPLAGFMDSADWRSVCEACVTSTGCFWPIPITLSTTKDQAGRLREGQAVALTDADDGEVIGTITIGEKYAIDKRYECGQIFRTTDPAHPGVAKVMAQGEVNLAGAVRVFSESSFPQRYGSVYLRPSETRQAFQERGWSTVAALQLRNPMHRSHEYLAKTALEVCDGVLLHQLLGHLKPGDIPAAVRVKAVNALVEGYFVAGTCIQAGYPLEMRYAGPREALLHAVFRQNYGCSHLIVGRDHAGVGAFYGPFDSQRIFDEIPSGALELKPMKIDWTFYCRRCDGMASAKTCPHGDEERLLVSGSRLRNILAAGGEVPAHFSRPEVLAILREYYAIQEGNGEGS